MPMTSRARKPDRSTTSRPSAVTSSILPAQTTEVAKASRAAVCSAAGAPAARNRGFSNSATTLPPTLRKASTWVSPSRARSSPTGAEPRPVFSAET
jgi:hypothetical protein